jgi:hypothetical protein
MALMTIRGSSKSTGLRISNFICQAFHDVVTDANAEDLVLAGNYRQPISYPEQHPVPI